MRSAADFDGYYRSPDPWGISRGGRRDKALSRAIGHHINGKTVLELGCGEGHLTASIFDEAAAVTGIDISPVAISRAEAANIPNARFETADFLSVSFEGYDVIAAIECLYYLSPSEQEQFFLKLGREHTGLFVLTGPIIGSNQYRTYFTDEGIRETFARHGLELVEYRNLNAYRQAPQFGATVAAVVCRLPFCEGAVDILPQSYVYQRCYVARCSAPAN